MQATELAPTYRSNPNGDDLDVACALDSQSMADLGHTGIVAMGVLDLRGLSIAPLTPPSLIYIPDRGKSSKPSWRRRAANWCSTRARQAHLQIANRVHQSLLSQPVRHPRIDIDARSLPMDGVGGDYCQVLFPDESCCYLTMCDVTGHGIGPALLATRVSSEVRRLVFNRLRPVEIVARLNAFVLDLFGDAELQLSFFAAQLDLRGHSITYSGAGHPGPLLIHQGSGLIETLESQNLLMGVAEHCLSDRPEQSSPWSPGDRLLLFTDG